MAQPPDQDRTQNVLSDDFQSLLREHQRLRSDVERLLVQKQRLLQEKESDGAGKNGGGKEGNDEKVKDEGKEKGEGDEKKDSEDKDQQEEPKPPLKERARSWARAHPLGVVLLVIGIVVLAVAMVLFWMYLQSYVSTDDAEVDGHTNQIGSRVNGTVTAVYVEDTDVVKEGQVLAELDSRDYVTALAKAKANLAQALAELNAQSPNVPITQTTEATNVSTSQLEVVNAQAALEQAQQNYQSALAEVKQAQANAQNARTEEVRYRDLADKQEVSREQYDQRATTARAQEQLVESKAAAADAAQKVVKQREAALGQVQQRYKEAQSNQPRQVAAQQATVETRRANVEAAKAQVQQAQLDLSYCKITAPVAGIVGSKTVEVGQQVAPGQEMLAITPTQDIWVTANFKETQITHMRPGQGVTLYVDALDLKFDGNVENMPGATGAKYSLLPPENATGNYVKVVQRLPVRIRIKAGQPGFDRLRPGMSVEPKVWLK